MALGLGLVVLTGLEFFWRARDYGPTVADDFELWSIQRDRVDAAGERTLVLLGMSRIGTGFSAARFRERYPDWEVVQLAVNGHRPLAAYRNLAADSRFNGVAVVATSAWDFIPGAPEQDGHVAHYRGRPSPGRRLDRHIATFLQERFVVLHPGLMAARLLKRVVSGRTIERRHRVWMGADRFQHAVFGNWRLSQELRRLRLGGQRSIYEQVGMPPPEEWLKRVEALEPSIAAIAARGGKTVFVRMPLAEESYRLDEQHFPRRRYWDRWQAQTEAELVHFSDLPAITSFEYPDLLHTDARDAPKLTSALLAEFRRRGILPARR